MTPARRPIGAEADRSPDGNEAVGTVRRHPGVTRARLVEICGRLVIPPTGDTVGDDDVTALRRAGERSVEFLD